jgi:hypothetical protein
MKRLGCELDTQGMKQLEHGVIRQHHARREHFAQIFLLALAQAADVIAILSNSRFDNIHARLLERFRTLANV